MNSKEVVVGELKKVPQNEPILVGSIYKKYLYSQMSELAFMQIISRLCRAGELARVSKGIYCFAKTTRFGTIVLSDKEIEEYYTANNEGMVVGYSLYNKLGVTTQISKKVIIYSSKVEDNLKQIGNVTIVKCNLKYTNNVKAIIQMMELIRHCTEIQDLNSEAMLKALHYLSQYYTNEDFARVQETIKYPKWAIAFMKDILDYNNIKNNLGSYLSTLSKYKTIGIVGVYESTY